MNTSTNATAPAWLVSLQIAIILSAGALTLQPQLRVAPIVPIFGAASFANCAIMIWREWKTGRLSMTPRQLFERAQRGERFPKQTLGFAAVIASAIAQWHM